MNKWNCDIRGEAVLKVDVNSIKKNKHIREIFGIDDEKAEYETPLVSFAKASKHIIINTLNETGAKKSERINQLYDSKVNNEDLKFKVSPIYQLKKLPVKVTANTKNTNANCHSKEGSTDISRVNSNINNIVLKNKSQLSFTASKATKSNSQEVSNPVSKDLAKNALGKDDLLYVPCINCNNIISVDSIESHSDICLTIKDELRQAEESKFSYHLVDFKLKKLKDHIQNMQESYSKKMKEETEVELMQVLLLAIKDAICTAKIAVSSINLLKKLIISLDITLQTCNGTWTSQILIERLRVLIQEKICVIKSEIKKLAESKRLTEINKSGNINSIKESLLKEKEQKLKLYERLQAEKEMMIRKTVNLESSAQQIFNNHRLSNMKGTMTKGEHSVPRQTSNENLLKSIAKPCLITSETRAEPNEEIINERLKCDDELDSVNISCVDFDPRDTKFSVINPFNPNFNEEEKSKIFSDTGKFSRIDIYEINEMLDLEEDKLSISNLKINQHNNLLAEISSDIENHKGVDSVSDCTSMSSHNSEIDFTELSPQILHQKPIEIIYDAKKLYQDFVKICLKVKFEKLHNTHHGREVPDKVLFKESIKRGIRESDWPSFVLSELQNPHKYSQYICASSKKVKLQKNVGAYLDVINEEN